MEILDGFDTLTNSISWGLPKESALRRKQYEYYRDALLGFPHRRPPPKEQPSRLLLPYKKHIKTIPADNRPEFAAYKLITKYLGEVVYFADPYVSWQKGAIENTNSSDSIFPNKPTSMISDKKTASIQKENNSRPRQKLKFENPKLNS